MPSSESRVPPPDESPSETSKQQSSKGPQSRAKPPRSNTSGGASSTYVSPYRQTQRSTSIPTGASRTNSATAANPAHAAKFKDIVTKFNEKQDEKIPLPTNKTPASRMASPAARIRKSKEEVKKPTPQWKPGGSSAKPPTKDSPKGKPTRSTSALGSYESRTTSRASSRASTISTPTEHLRKRPSASQSVGQDGHRGSTDADDDTTGEMDYTPHPSEKRRSRSRSFAETERPILTLQTEPSALRHRRSRSNIEMTSASKSKESSKSSKPTFDQNTFSKSTAKLESALSPISPLAKTASPARKSGSQVGSPRGRMPTGSTSSSRMQVPKTEPASKKLSPSQVSPHSSRYVPAPAKSPTLRAYVTVPPPKKSPPLRSSRPRAQVSTSGNTPKKLTKTLGTTPASPINKSDGSLQNRTPSRAKKKIPELGSVDFAARRATIQAAFNKSLKESNPKVIVREPSNGSLKETSYDLDGENQETASARSHKESRKPIQDTILEEDSEEEHIAKVVKHAEEYYQSQAQESDQQDDSSQSHHGIGRQSQPIDSGSEIEFESGSESVIAAAAPASLEESESDFEGLGASAQSPVPETPLDQLPSYAQASQDTDFHAAAAFYSQENEKRSQTGPSHHSEDLDDDERVEMAEKVEMVERPSSKRFSLQGLPSLRKHIDSLPPVSQRVEDSPLSPFTKSLLNIGEPSRTNVVPLIIEPDPPVEPRKPPTRLMDISQFLRPDSMATMETEWTDVSADDRSDAGHTEYDYTPTPQQDLSPQDTMPSISPRHSRLFPNGVRLSMGGASITSPTDGGLYTPTDDDGATIVSFIDRYDEPREDFLSPYIDSPMVESPASDYGTTSAGSERDDTTEGDDEDEDEGETTDQGDGDDNYEGDDDDLSNCSSETMHSSARPSIESAEEWQNASYSSNEQLPIRPESPPTPRRNITVSSPPPPTPPPKDRIYLPPVPRKNSIPYPEPYARPPPTQVQGRRFQPITLPEIAPDTEPLGLAIRLASPLSIASLAYEQDMNIPPAPLQPPPRPPLEHSHSAPSSTPFSPPSSYYSDQDASRRSSTFTSTASPRVSEITLPSSLGASMHTPMAPGRDSGSEQKALVKRKHIMKELLDTEKSFFQDMTVTEEIYKGTAAACSALTPEDIKVMFGNTDAIVQFSKLFQDSLKSAVASVYVIKKARSNMNSSSVSLANSVSGDENIRGSIVSDLSFLSDDDKDRKTVVGEAFRKHLPKMEKIYGDYCKNHEAAVARLQKLESTPGIAIWLRECKTVAEDLTNAWSLESLLIKPVQRILKYPLMLRALLDVTPIDHPDYQALEWAEKELRLAADRINELKKRKDIVEKIVRKRNDTDIRHGLSKLITRRTEMLRQTMGTSEAVIDPMYNKMVENFHMHYVQLQLVFRDIDGYIIKTNEFFQQFLEIPASMREFIDVSATSYPELEAKWRKFDSAMKDMVKLALSEHTHRVKRHCVEPIETLLRLYDNPQRLMLKRNKKSVDYARFTAIKEKGAVPDKKTKELAEAYTALNEALIDELPALFNLTKKLVTVALENFVELQFQWNQTFSGTLITSLPDAPSPERPSEIVANFKEDFAYHEGLLKELGMCNGSLLNALLGTTVTTLQAMTSPSSAGLPSSSSVSLEERDSISQHRPNTADPVRERERERSTSFSNRSVSSLDHHHRRHSGEMPVIAAAMSAIATAMPGASQMVGQQSVARARASSSVYPHRGPHSPGSPSVLRSLSASSPTRLAVRPPTSHPRPPSSATSSGFAPVPETTTAPDLSRESSPSSQVYTGAFSSALPMSDSEPSPGPSRPTSRHSNGRRSESRRPALTLATDSAPLFVAISMYEFNIDKQKREAGFTYLTYVQGEVFDVIGIKGEIWLARNQDDPNGEIGWIWCKHFQTLDTN